MSDPKEQEKHEKEAVAAEDAKKRELADLSEKEKKGKLSEPEQQRLRELRASTRPVIIDHELTEKEKADAAAFEIVARTAPEPSIELYLWLKRKLFHEKGLDDVWHKIATHLGALEPPEGWVDEDNPGIPPPPEGGALAAKSKAQIEAEKQAAKHEPHGSLNP